MMQQSKTKAWVQPLCPLVPGIRYLSPLDQYMVRIMIPIMLIFNLKPEADQDNIVESLQSGLSSTISELNFLAANIIPQDQSRNTIQLEYDENPGVWFYESNEPMVSFKKLAEYNFPISMLSPDKFVPEPRCHNARSCPAFAVQATFIDGGFILGFCLHHSVIDGTGINILLRTWSKHTNDASSGLPIQPCLNEADQDMSNAFYPAVHRPLSDFSTYDSADTTTTCATQASKQARIMKMAMDGEYLALSKFNPRTQWHLSASKMDQLRELVMTHCKGPHGSFVTDNAIAMSLVWVHLTSAREAANPGCISKSSILTSVNVRNRLDPPLPQNYPFNSIVIARATATASELLLNGPATPETLYTLASRIVASVQYWTADRISALVGAIQTCLDVENAMVPQMGYDLLTTSPSALADSLAEVSWGKEFGKAVCLREAFPSFADGVSMCLPSIMGGFDIQIWAAYDATQRLQNDEAWMGWMHRVM